MLRIVLSTLNFKINFENVCYIEQLSSKWMYFVVNESIESNL